MFIVTCPRFFTRNFQLIRQESQIRPNSYMTKHIPLHLYLYHKIYQKSCLFNKQPPEKTVKTGFARTRTSDQKPL